MELETVNKLYLELSQFATAKTKNDLELEKITERSRRRGKLLADIFNHEDVNLPLELMNRIDAEVMGHNSCYDCEVNRATSTEVSNEP